VLRREDVDEELIGLYLGQGSVASSYGVVSDLVGRAQMQKGLTRRINGLEVQVRGPLRRTRGSGVVVGRQSGFELKPDSIGRCRLVPGNRCQPLIEGPLPRRLPSTTANAVRRREPLTTPPDRHKSRLRRRDPRQSNDRRT
jgi:hypothetical protein